MAKPVDLRGKVVHSEPVPPKKPAKVDPAGLKTPPAAQAPIRMPLPPGRVVDSATARRSFTPLEQEMLQKAGWQPGQPIPPEVAALASAIHEEASRPSPVVLPPGTPPLKVETVDIEQLDPQAQARIRSSMDEVLAGRPAATPDVSNLLQQPPATERVSMASQAIPGWKPPGNPFYQPAVPNPMAQAPAPTPPGPTPEPVPETDAVEVELDIPQEQTAYKAAAEDPLKPPVDDVQVAAQRMLDIGGKDSAFGGPTLTHCPHCGWDLALPDIPEPDYAEKQAFLQSVLGQKPFIKDYLLMGDALRVRFRTLTTREVDVIYKQVFWEREHGQIPSVEDYWEKVNRYRLYLQTCQVVSSAFHYDLPDGYDKESNPNAEAHWQFDLPEDPGMTALPQIENYMVSTVYRTEALQRIVYNTCAKFNRLVAKLEGLVDNTDFWKPTGERS